MSKRKNETQGSKVLDCVKAQVVDVGQRLKSRASELKPFLEKHRDDVTMACVLVAGYYGVRMLFRCLPAPLSLTISFVGGVFLSRWMSEQTHELKAELLRALGGETTQARKAG